MTSIYGVAIWNIGISDDENALRVAPSHRKFWTFGPSMSRFPYGSCTTTIASLVGVALLGAVSDAKKTSTRISGLVSPLLLSHMATV